MTLSSIHIIEVIKIYDLSIMMEWKLQHAIWRFLAYTEIEKWSNFYLRQLHQTGNIEKTQIRLSVVTEQISCSAY